MIPRRRGRYSLSQFPEPCLCGAEDCPRCFPYSYDKCHDPEPEEEECTDPEPTNEPQEQEE